VPQLSVAVRKPTSIQKNCAAAIADAQEGIKLEPDNHLSYGHLGLACLTACDYQGALKAYTDALTLAPEKPELVHGVQLAQFYIVRSRPFQGRRRTFDATNMPLRVVWDLIVNNASRPESAAMRQFTILLKSARRPQMPLPCLLSIPRSVSRESGRTCSGESAVERRYPLLVYLHSAASCDICRGDKVTRQLSLVADEAPHSFTLERCVPGLVDEFIGFCPCCPANIGGLTYDLPRILRRRKIFWFKTCDVGAYSDWDFTGAQRCVEMELLTIEQLAQVCKELPVDPTRIYFFGSSCGGYAVLRLAELIPRLPAAVVPMAGYYPNMPAEDHDPTRLAMRLQGVHIWPMHCKQDKLCRVDMPHVSIAYNELIENNGVEIDWIPGSVARGSQSNFHSAYRSTVDRPDEFYQRLLGIKRDEGLDANSYLQERLTSLLISGK